jgi:hypothetical protein
MTRVTCLGVLLASACASSAFAGEQTHSFEASGFLQVNYQPNLRALFAADRIEGTWYPKPLVDDGQQPLELLPFLQHSSNVTLTAALQTFLQADVTWFPWQDTGVISSVGASALLEGLGAFTSYSLGAAHYFGPDLRVELLYQGQRNNADVVSTDTTLEATLDFDDDATVNVFYLMNRSLMLSGSATFGVTRVLTRDLAAGTTGVLATRSQGLKRVLTLGATGYLGQQASIFLIANISDEPLTSVATIAGDTTSTTSTTNEIRPTLAVGAQWFFNRSLYLRAQYKAQLIQDVSDDVAAPLLSAHQIAIKLGGYL